MTQSQNEHTVTITQGDYNELITQLKAYITEADELRQRNRLLENLVNSSRKKALNDILARN